MLKKFKEKYFLNIKNCLEQLNLKDFKNFLKIIKKKKKIIRL